MEAAAIALAAEQVASTTVEAGIVYGVAKPTPALSATYTRISSEAFLPRLNHSLTVVNGQLFLFGGETDDGNLAGDEVHIVSLPLKKAGNEGKPDYKCVPSLGEGEDGNIPGPRAGHIAVSQRERIYVFGGRGKDKKPVEEMGRVWVFNTTTLGWSHIDPIDDTSIPPARYLHGGVFCEYPPPLSKATENATYKEQITSSISKIPSLVTKSSNTDSIEPHGTLIVHGGLSSTFTSLHDTWTFNIATRTWTALPSVPASIPALPALSMANDILYLVSGNSDFANNIHTLPLKRKADTNERGEAEASVVPAQEEWSSTSIPTNPLTPGPKARTGAGLIPITTGAGREYLLYLMGEKASFPAPSTATNPEKQSVDDSTNNPVFYSDLWAYSLPASSLTPAGLKDATRSTLGLSISSSSWSEVKVEANIEAGAEEGSSGKSHPGPRAWFAADVVGKEIDGGKGVVMWGGRNGRGEVEGDGWLVSVG